MRILEWSRWLVPLLGLSLVPLRADAATAFLPAGSEGGALRINPGFGGMGYVYPVKLPAGPRGFKPQVALAYSSQRNATSWIATGWGLGLGSIERIGATGGAPMFTTTDKYVLNLNGASHRLVITDAAGGLYRTEHETFLRIERYSGSEVCDAQGCWGPADYWRVTDTSGTQYWFGARQGAHDAAYHVRGVAVISEIQDTFGQTILYTYDKGSDTLDSVGNGKGYGTIEPTSIGWSGYHLSFRYEALAHPIIRAQGGVAVKTTRRLARLAVAAGEGASEVGIREYSLEVEALPSSGRPFLASIQEHGYGDAGELVGLPPVFFDYTPAEAQFGEQTLFASDHHGWDLSRTRTAPGVSDEEFDAETTFTTGLMDMNGDGRPDYVTAPGEDELFESPWQVELNHGSGFAAPQPWSFSERKPFLAERVVDMMAADWPLPVESQDTARAVDFNGDGRTDFVRHVGTDGVTQYLEVFINNGTGFDPAQTWIVPAVYARSEDGAFPLAHWKRSVLKLPWNGKPYIYEATIVDMVDMDGDGWLDIVASSDLPGPLTDDPTLSAEPWTVLLNTGTGFSQPLTWANSEGTALRYSEDHTNLGFDYALLTMQRLIDVNADGLPDLVEQDFESVTGRGYWAVRYNNGRGFEASRHRLAGTDHRTYLELTYKFTSGPAMGQALMDMNGDGLVDVVRSRRSSGTDTWTVQYNTGSGFAVALAINHDSLFVTRSDTWIHTLDLNGDGCVDYVEPFASTAVINGKPRDDPDTWSVKLGAAVFPDLVTQVTHPLGGQTDIAYLPSSSAWGSHVPRVMPLVAAVKRRAKSYWAWWSDSPDEFWTRYLYYNGRVGRSLDTVAFLGFRQVRQRNETTGDYAWSYFTQTFPSNVGKLSHQYFYEADDTGTVRLRHIKYVRFRPDANAPYFTPPEMTREYIYDTAGRHSTTLQSNYGYDGFGNITSRADYGDTSVTGDERTVVTTFRPNTYAWITALPVQERLYEGIGSSRSLVAQTTWYYDGASSAYRPPQKGFMSQITTGIGPDASTVRYNQPRAGVYVPDAYGRVTSKTSARGYVTLMAYAEDYPGFLLATINPKGHVSRRAYYGVNGQPMAGGFFGALEWEQGPNAETRPNPAIYRTSYEYDALGRTTKITRPYDDEAAGESGSVWFDYQSVSFADPAYHRVLTRQRETPAASPTRTSYSYVDGFGRQWVAIEPAEGGGWIYSKTVYDSRGQVASQSAPSTWAEMDARLTHFEYDGLGRTTRIDRPAKDGGRRVRTQQYDGLRQTVVDELGRTTVYIRDVYGNVVQVQDAMGNVATYDYDVLGNLTEAWDAQGNRSSWSYDSLGRLIWSDDADRGTREFEYDAAGNLTRVESPNGTSVLTYDSLGRVATKDLDDDGEIDARWWYDSPFIGRLGTVATAEAGTWRTVTWRSYDLRGRLSDETRMLRGIDGTTYHHSSWDYDSMDRVISRRFPDRARTNVGWVYNRQGLVESIPGYIDNVDYNASGQMERIDYANGVSTDMAYEPSTDTLDSVLTSHATSGTIQHTLYTYDDVGNLLYLSMPESGNHHRYSYDALDRLTTVWKTIPPYKAWRLAERYAYDAVGNMTGRNGATQAYEVGTGNVPGCDHGGPHALSEASDLGPYCYDAAGNMVSGGGRTLEWSAEGRPLRIDDAGRGSSTLFTYDGFGDRVYKEVTAGGQTSAVKYIGPDAVSKVAGDTGVDVVGLSLNGTRVVEIEHSDDSGAPALRFYHPDHLGGTQVVTDGTGQVVEEVSYASFGATISDTAPQLSSRKFTGQELDVSTGLYDYNARLYDPQIGRFVSADPAIPDPLNPQALNRYSYALNNPLRYVDPSGMFFAERFFSVDWWIGGFKGAYNGATIGNAICGGYCGLAGGIIGFGVGAELNYRAGQPDAGTAIKVANFSFQVATSAAAAVAGGTTALGYEYEAGTLSAGVVGGARAAANSMLLHEGMDAIDSSGTMHIIWNVALAYEAGWDGLNSQRRWGVENDEVWRPGAAEYSARLDEEAVIRAKALVFSDVDAAAEIEALPPLVNPFAREMAENRPASNLFGLVFGGRSPSWGGVSSGIKLWAATTQSGATFYGAATFWGTGYGMVTSSGAAAWEHYGHWMAN